MSTITFPTQDQVIRDIEVLKQVQKIKKLAFMNACDTSKLPKGAQVLNDPKAAKKIHWVQDIDRKATRKLNKRIKVITKKKRTQITILRFLKLARI